MIGKQPATTRSRKSEGSGTRPGGGKGGEKGFFFWLLLQGLEQHSVTLGGGEGRGKRKVETSTYLCQRVDI